MAITTAVASSYKSEVLAGTHVAADVYKLSAFVSDSTGLRHHIAAKVSVITG